MFYCFLGGRYGDFRGIDGVVVVVVHMVGYWLKWWHSGGGAGYGGGCKDGI